MPADLAHFLHRYKWVVLQYISAYLLINSRKSSRQSSTVALPETCLFSNTIAHWKHNGTLVHALVILWHLRPHLIGPDLQSQNILDVNQVDSIGVLQKLHPTAWRGWSEAAVPDCGMIWSWRSHYWLGDWPLVWAAVWLHENWWRHFEHLLWATDLSFLLTGSHLNLLFVFATTSFPLTSTWPHLRCNVDLEEGEYWKNCLCVTVLCTTL